ncbi:hypothetical protein ACTXG7_26550 [Mycolicibacterium sp. Dal123E01]|uniref:hypothetical protein n=1 Tax=Mycolicibacterium sp. Dal123E01 TaxID=3457578 RepID=UPI00403EAF5F
MLLAIDVRNTHTVVGLVSGSGDHAHGQRRVHRPERRPQRLAVVADRSQLPHASIICSNMTVGHTREDGVERPSQKLFRKVQVERNRLNLDDVEEGDKHFAVPCRLSAGTA